MEFVFTNTIAPSQTYFYEGPAPRDRVGVNPAVYYNTGSIDTSAGDAWTQGVELTSQRKYDAGVAKIWSGEPGHQMLKLWYGMDSNWKSPDPWKDIDLFDPLAFIKAETSGAISTYTFPIITGDSDQHENYELSGIIEPLTIRARVAFFSIDSPFESHETKGALMDGNSDMWGASDQIVTLYRFDRTGSRITPFLDAVDTFAGIALPGFFIGDRQQLHPYDDTEETYDVIASISATTMIDMHPMSDSYVPRGYAAATAGFDYGTNDIVLTDSIAFGGMSC